MPKGWEVKPYGPPVVTKCRKSPFDSAIAFGGSHFQASTLDLQQQTGLFATKKLARQAFFTLRSPREMRCFKRVSERGMEQFSGRKILQRLRDLKAPAVDTREERLMAAIIASPLGPVRVFVDRLAAEVGRTVIVMKITSGFQPVSPAFVDRVTRIPLMRAARAEGEG